MNYHHHHFLLCILFIATEHSIAHDNGLETNILLTFLLQLTSNWSAYKEETKQGLNK